MTSQEFSPEWLHDELIKKTPSKVCYTERGVQTVTNAVKSVLDEAMQHPEVQAQIKDLNEQLTKKFMKMFSIPKPSNNNKKAKHVQLPTTEHP